MREKVVCATKVAVWAAKNLYRVEHKKNCNVINTENLCFQKYNLSYSFFPDCQEKCHAYDMPCCVHFTGYSQQLNFHMHYSSPVFLSLLLEQQLGKETKRHGSLKRERGRMKNNSMYETRSDICNIFIFTCDEDGNHFTLYIKFMLQGIFYNRLFHCWAYLNRNVLQYEWVVAWVFASEIFNNGKY